MTPDENQNVRDLRFSVVMSILVSWVVITCGLLHRYQRFGGTHSPEDGGKTLTSTSKFTEHYYSDQYQQK